jgi:flagellar biosynthesis protein FliQ
VDAFDGLLRDALVTTAAISLPVLFVGTAVGTAVAIVQAATQVQEQTLTLLPKIVAVGATVAALGGFGMHLLSELFSRALSALPAIVAGP